MPIFQDKTIVITGGTGSLGKVLTKRILSEEEGRPRKVIIFSRDEAKQHFMRQEFLHKKGKTEESIYNNFRERLEFRIGDVRDYASVCQALRNADIVVNAAALKQVPSCEYFPGEAVMTNITGSVNIARAINENAFLVETVVGVSTDKACRPVNVMGMTKAIQERIFISANIHNPHTRYVCVRYGNVLASRGSVIPLFHDQIKMGGPVTITTPEMTRFLLSLNQAVDTIYNAIKHANRGETVVPKVRSTKMTDLAQALIGNRNIDIVVTGIRPGEKIHEVMVSQEEAVRTHEKHNYFFIESVLPELVNKEGRKYRETEYSSQFDLMDLAATQAMLKSHGLLIDDLREEGEFLA